MSFFSRSLLLVLSMLLAPDVIRAQPVQSDPVSTALAHLRSDLASQRGSAPSNSQIEARDHHTTRRTGVTSVNVRQRQNGIEIFGADVTVVVGPDGRVLRQHGRLSPGSAAQAPSPIPMISAASAITLAARHLGLTATEPLEVLETNGDPEQVTRFNRAGLSRDEIRARLNYFPLKDGTLRLAWNLVLHVPSGAHWWNLFVDAETGSVLRQYDWVRNESYRVFPVPLASPDQGSRSLVVDPFDAVASPYGWHDTNGIAGAEFTDTRGNNVEAQEDTDANDIAASRPDGGGGLVFDFPFDSSLPAPGLIDASVTQLFYANNKAHDIFYAYGFDEASGNFQQNNYGRGGLAGDPVAADSQDGSDTNNAQFGTPPDGFSPHMEMFLFDPVGSNSLTVNTPASLAGSFSAGISVFGSIPVAPGLTGNLVRAEDAANGAGPTTTDGCSAFTNAASISGTLALIDRGTCLFVEKVKNAQDAGAIGAVIVNNAGDAVITMAGEDPLITIPSLFIGQTNGTVIANELALGEAINANLLGYPPIDSSFAMGVVLHEYGHGVSTRLTGGASNSNCVDNAQSEGMGEGWSDLFGLALTAKSTEQATDARPVGNYMLGQPLTGPGIRSQPYSTDLAVNNLTFSDIGSLPQPHGVGEVWTASLWEMYWNLVTAYGFDEDLVSGSGGNNKALELVVDGLKLQPCNPTFLEARDAILLAESTGSGANECLLWKAFAKRGMGSVATDSGNSASLVVSEDFSLPAQCAEYCGDGVVDGGENCDDGNLLALDGCSARCQNEVSVSFFGTATGGTVDLTLSGQALQLTTLPGQSAETVAANLAAAILADPVLSAQGVLAVAVGSDVVTDASVDLFVVNDTGLGTPVPALATGALVALMLLTAASGMRRLARPGAR